MIIPMQNYISDATFMGFKVIVRNELDNVPKMQLCPKVRAVIEPYNPEFVKETDKWMLQHFGTKDEILVSETNRFIAVGPKTYAKLRKLRSTFGGVNV